MDAIVSELSNADRVRFVVPELTTGDNRLLDTLEVVLTRRGIDVERRRACWVGDAGR